MIKNYLSHFFAGAFGIRFNYSILVSSILQRL